MLFLKRAELASIAIGYMTFGKDMATFYAMAELKQTTLAQM